MANEENQKFKTLSQLAGAFVAAVESIPVALGAETFGNAYDSVSTYVKAKLAR